MKIWLVTFSAFGIPLDAVVVAPNYGTAVTMLKLTADERLRDAVEIGVATGDETPRIVTEDRI